MFVSLSSSLYKKHKTDLDWLQLFAERTRKKNVLGGLRKKENF